jgi:hypothetical protein
VNQISKPTSCQPEQQNYSPKRANQECNSGIKPQSSQEFATEEPLRIENVAHKACKLSILPSLVAKANRSSTPNFSTVFHVEHYSGF